LTGSAGPRWQAVVSAPVARRPAPTKTIEHPRGLRWPECDLRLFRLSPGPLRAAVPDRVAFQPPDVNGLVRHERWGAENERGAMNEAAGRNVVVTGGGTGIGRAVAERFVRAGDRVVIVGRRREVLQSAVEELRGLGPAVAPVVCDLADADDVESAL